MRFRVESTDSGLEATFDGNQLSEETIEAALKAGAAITEETVREIITKGARTPGHPTGQLAGVVNTDFMHAALGSSARIGWDTSQKLKKESTRRMKSGHHWGSRKVTTVADVGRILEYSNNRVLRHMELGIGMAGPDAEAEAQAALEEAVEKTLSSMGL